MFSNESSFFNRTANESNTRLQKYCCCLFENETNDFFKVEKRRKSSNFVKEIMNRRKSRQKSVLLTKQRDEAKSLGSIFQKSLMFEDVDELNLMIEKRSENQNFVEENQRRLIEPIIEQEEKSRNCQDFEICEKNLIFIDETKNARNSQNEKSDLSIDSSLKKSEFSFMDHNENEFFEPLLPVQNENFLCNSSLNNAENSTANSDVDSESITNKHIRANNDIFDMSPKTEPINKDKLSFKAEEIKKFLHENDKEISDENSFEKKASIENLFQNLITTKKVQLLESSLSLYLDEVLNKDEHIQKVSETNKEDKLNMRQTSHSQNELEDKTSLQILFENLPDLRKVEFLESFFSLYLDELFLCEDSVNQSKEHGNKERANLKIKSNEYLEIKNENSNSGNSPRKKFKQRYNST
jgi:hypothetical protein